MKHREIKTDKAYKDLFEAFLKIENTQECRAFLSDLCTPAELEALADRWRVARLLIKGMPYREISEVTGVSSATVTRVARFLFNGNQGYKKIIERMEK